MCAVLRKKGVKNKSHPNKFLPLKNPFIRKPGPNNILVRRVSARKTLLKFIVSSTSFSEDDDAEEVIRMRLKKLL